MQLTGSQSEKMVSRLSLFGLLGLLLLVQSQSEQSQEKLPCPVCSFTTKNGTKLEIHVNKHLDEAISAAIPPTKVDLNDTTDDMKTRTRSIISRMNRTASTEASSDVNRILIGMDIDHYATGSYDTKWDRGYRNVQMMFSVLFQNMKYYTSICESWYAYNLHRESMASIMEIQKMIYNAWMQGFDEDGAYIFNYKLINTKKGIGATEVATLLASLGFEYQVIDFHEPTSEDGYHPELFKWVLKYFQENKERLPLWLQREGQSLLIFGIEQSGSDLTLLVLDPAHSPQQVVATFETENPLELFRYKLDSLKANQYQVVEVKGLFKNEKDRKASKYVSSLRIP